MRCFRYKSLDRQRIRYRSPYCAGEGWEFANFAFGGSDFVVIFEPGAGVTYQPSRQGERYGCFGGVTTCDATPGEPPPYPRR